MTLEENKKAVRLMLKSASFILGCVLVISAIVLIAIDKQARSNAVEAAKKESEHISDPEKKVEILDRHLDKVPEHDGLIGIFWVVGLLCILNGASNAVKQAVKTEPTQNTEEAYAQRLSDFISGKNDDLPNSKK